MRLISAVPRELDGELDARSATMRGLVADDVVERFERLRVGEALQSAARRRGVREAVGSASGGPNERRSPHRHESVHQRLECPVSRTIAVLFSVE